MILLIDAGNTRIKWGLREPGVWRERGAVPTADAASLAQAAAAWPSVQSVYACSVAGAAVEAAIATALGPLAARLYWCRSGALVQAGVINRYRRPAQLGADRWAALIGAWGLVGGDCVVVNCGTATTIDLLRRVRDERGKALADGHGRPLGEFLGGVIVPGLAMMRAALAGNTAGLPLADGHYEEHPQTTDDAIETGCIEAQIGAIERLSQRLPAGTPRVLGGGAADALAAHLGAPLQRAETLVLDGLARIAEEYSVLT